MPTGSIILLTSATVFNMKHMKLNWIFSLTFLALLGTACVDQNFDEPPVEVPGVDITANTTILDLKNLHTIGEVEKIEDDLIIEGVVIADDRSGNYYKTIVLQDETSGIELKINSTGLFASYPIGTKLYIKCKGLYLGDYNNLIQLGSIYIEDNEENFGGIEEVMLPQHVFVGTQSVTPVPRVVKIEDLVYDDVSTLIQLDDVQFADGDAGQTYADAANRFSVNHDIEDCDENTLVLRSSGYADFADSRTPNGKGSIVGVYSIYQTTPQMYIRDLDDVNMEGKRCDGGGTGGGPKVVDALNESFDGVGNNEDVGLDGWSNIIVKGERLWRGKVFDNNHYAQATAFNDNSPEMEAWMITPGLNVDIITNFSFESAQAFHNHDGLSVWISTDYDGEDFVSANWTEINTRLAMSSDDEHAFIPSGNIDLSSYSGVVHIGFKYVGSDQGRSDHILSNR